MRRKLNQLLALLLCAVMVSSELTGLITPAQAAPAAVAADSVSAAAPLAATAATSGDPLNFDVGENGRPNLFVHFLGDNYYYPSGATAGLGNLPVPAGYDQSKETNPDSTDAGASAMDTPGNTWNRYRGPAYDMVEETATSGAQVIFWVGLGIDRREIFELLKDNQGLTSLEAGFYYDSQYVEPYVDASGSFQATIEKANIANSDYPANTQWSADYEIIRAETDMAPKTDLITQEEIQSPSIYDIMGDTSWKMTYVSLELKDPLDANANRRLAGDYVGVYDLAKDTNGDPIVPAAAHGTGMQNAGGDQAENDYQYLLLIPFRLKRYGDPEKLAIRLARNASHFSIGAGTEGETTYAAWERTTTRNPGKDIKLLTRFNGDLFLFGSDAPPHGGEVEYTATLHLDRKTVLNTAQLGVDGDPAVWPVKATQDQEVIYGLRSGIGMRVKTTPQAGYTVTVKVTYLDGDDKTVITHTYQTVTANREYTFVMPIVPATVKNVDVWIGFSMDDPQYHVFLSELERDSLGKSVAPSKLGNAAVITTNLDSSTGATTSSTVEIHSYDTPYDPHPDHPTGFPLDSHSAGPMGVSDAGNMVKINVTTHADYMAVVRIASFSAASSLITSGLTITTANNDHSVNTTNGKITLPYGGTISLTMPASDLDVEISYQPAPRYKATLEVYHKDGAAITPMNTAQMAYLVYDDFNESSTAYSGVVYHLAADAAATPPVAEDHRAVYANAADTEPLPWVAASQATYSGSLAGDTGRKGMDWNPRELTSPEDPVLGTYTVMTQLRSATSQASFATSMTALDLNTQDVGGVWTGLRKDLQGKSYGDGDVAQLKGYLWELRTRILKDASLKTTYDKTVTQTVSGVTSTAYSYLDLTAAQVQAYVLDILEAQETERTNQRQYELANQAYLRAKVLYETENAKTTLAGKVVAPSAPIAPEGLSAADSNGVRKYQDAHYQNGAAGDYLYDYYQYLNSYQTYITAVSAAGSVSGIAAPGTPPTKAALATIPLRTDAAARTMLAGYSFKANPVSASATIETRESRKVWVALEGDSAYYVSSVELYEVNAANQSTNLITTITPTKESGYVNLWSFTMPRQNCAVRVTYAPRETRDVRVQIIGADGQAENLASVEAYRYADHDAVHYPTETPAVSPVLHTISNAGSQSVSPYPAAPASPADPDPRYIYNVMMDTTVTVRVKAKEGYDVAVEVENLSLGDAITCTKVTAPNPADGDIYTFKVAKPNISGDVISVKVTYIKKLEQYDAYIDYYTMSGSPIDTGNEALWRLENPGPPASVSWTDELHGVYVGTHLVGDVTVQPGYYIYGVVARGASGNYTYVMSGDGYNNGYGTTVSGVNQPVKIDVDMPAEDLYVEVYFKKGLPPAEPDYPLTLTVKDPDNTESDLSKAAKNWATASVYATRQDTAPLDTLGEVGRNQAHGNGVMTDYGFYKRGNWVKVDFHADTGYYVSKVTVGPSSLGVAMLWEGPNSVSFYMPPGSTGICVEFAKGEEPPTYFLDVRETWFDLSVNSTINDLAVAEKNYVTQADSATIQSWNGGVVNLPKNTTPDQIPGAGASTSATGAAKSGEKVTMTYIVDESDWYVQSIILFSDGAATRLTDDAVDVTPATATANQKTYQVEFHMPSGNAEFTVHYRKGPEPDKKDYALTMVLYDDDNTAATKDDNRFSATITDPGGDATVHPKVELGLALATPLTTDVRHVHPGDLVTLETRLQPGYSVDYLIINPANLSLYPSWQSVTTDANGVTKGVTTFTMPNNGVAVVARYVKGEPHQYTANLILRPPAGYTADDVGMGTFAAPTGGSFTDYPKNAVYSTAQSPGTTIDYDLLAKDGFYIEKITIEPAVGAAGSLSGSFRAQDGSFVMPAANVNVNVWFKKGWPDDAKFGLTLEVHDPYQNANNYASLRSAGSAAFAAPDSDPVRGGESKTVWQAAYDRDTVVVDIHADAGYYCDAANLSVTDTQGNAIAWRYVPGGIAFTMPPRSTKVVVAFLKDDGKRPTYRADLVVLGAKTGDADPAKNDAVELKALPATAVGSPLGVGGGAITHLYAQDTLDLTATPGAGRHISSVYAVYTVGADTGVVPIYTLYTVGADTKLVPIGQPGALAQYIPDGAMGRLAMPEANVTIYVKFDDGAIKPTDKWVTLKVSGAADAGYAAAEIDEGTATKSMTVYTPTAASVPTGAAAGIDTRFTDQGREVIVTFTPNTSDGYDITGLEVYDKNGSPVPYEWISVLQDPDPLTDTNMWPDPPTDPSATILHPTWVPNPKRQIKLTVPVDSVTVHVTYGKVDKDRVYNAQIVVNDPYPAGTVPASRNNAWFGLLDDTAKARIRTAKPGDWIDLSLAVHPGYRIEYIKVLPQSYGIAPSLPFGDIYDQNTGFYMPNGDCTVYVKFVKDATEPKMATLVATGAPTGVSANYATIHSPISGTSAHAVVNGAAKSVQARPTVDWLTVDYYWAAGDAIASITVQDVSGTDLPYTQNEDPATRHGQLVLPMAAKDVLIIIEYKDDPAPVLQEVVLHVIDKDRDSAKPILREPDGTAAVNYAQVYTVSADTYLVGPDTYRLSANPLAAGYYESTATIYVPAGERVNLSACSDVVGLDGNGKVYIQSAYVLYAAGGQMLNMNLQPDTPPGYGFSGPKDAYFIVHQGRNDVYVTLTRDAPRTDKLDYSAVLMIHSPAADTSSEAGIHADQSAVSWQAAAPARRDKVRANDPNDTHAVVTAAQGEKLTVNVEPAAGYAIDYIQVTPLGFPLETNPTYNFTRVGNTFTFDMPHCNIAVTVFLKKAEKDQYKLTLHYQGVGSVSADDYAKVSWTHDNGTKEDIWAWNGSAGANPPGSNAVWGDTSSTMVKAGAPVTLWATLDSPDIILAAYVLSDGDLVPLKPSFPAGRSQSSGLEGVGESASAGDNTKADALADFDMPSADADVYLITSDTKPYDTWHTVILTASDYSPVGNDRGVNKGFLSYLDDQGDPVALQKTVISDGGFSHAILSLPETWGNGNSVYFTADTAPAPTYELSFSKTRLTQNVPPYPASHPSPKRTTPSVYYEIPVGNCNKVFHLVFESDEDLTLTVEIEDPDNPGNGTVEQKVTAATTGVATLTLTSQSIAGSYQIMSGVTSGELVDLTVTPHPGYQAYAKLYTVGADTVVVPLTAAGGGTLTGSFTMPPNTSRVVVTFYKGYTGTLTLENRVVGDFTGQATMSEDKRGLTPITVHSLNPSDFFTSLPNGTGLDAQVISDTTDRTLTGLLTVKGSTTLMAPEADPVPGQPDHYRHTIDRADATITLVLDSRDDHPDTYFAAVQVVDRPTTLTDAQMPTIVDTTDPTGQLTGSIWTTADKDDAVTVHVTVPAGYRVELSAARTDGTPVSLTATALTADGDAAFTMPAANVQVTVKYIKTHYRLTLHITDTSGVAGNATALKAANVLTPYAATLTQNGESTYVVTGDTVDLTAAAVTAPTPGAKIKYIFYQYGSQTHFVSLTAPATAYDSNTDSATGDLLTMPAADVDVTVVYTSAAKPPDPPEPDPYDYYIATAVKVDGDNHPDNQLLSIRNTTRTTLLDGVTALPAASPAWTAGYAGDAVQVSYQAAPGYYVTVTAKTADGATTLPVLQVGTTSLGNATAAFPSPGKDIVITVTYTKDKPDYPKRDVALQLVKHGKEKGNKAQTTDFTASALSGLSLNGTATTHAPGYPSGVVSTDPVELQKSTSTTGNDLRTLANWADGYEVVRMTMAVRNTTTGLETGEVDLLVSTYGANATSRCPVPPLAADEIPVVRVYYGNIYDATLHLVGADVSAGDTTSATDNQSATTAWDKANNSITKPIRNDGDWLDGYEGGGSEDIRTTAVAGPGRRLVGVVWESDLTGAQPTTNTVANRYDFTMPQDNVDFYAVYEPEPDDPKDKSYIAKVAFAADSAHTGSAGNAVSIRNTTNGSAAKGKYWVAAKGGDGVEITVKVDKGYQAQIITTKTDDQSTAVLNALPDIFDGATTRKPTSADAYQYYITRTQFVYNLTAGRTATFTMPANTDATVTIRFTKGYDLSLAVTDKTLLDGVAVQGKNTVDVTYTIGSDTGKLKWVHDDSAADQLPVYTPDPAVAEDRQGGEKVTTDVTTYDPGVKVKRTRTSPFTGTVTLTNTTTPPTTPPPTNYPFDMPSEDTVVNVLLQDKNAKDDLLAKVELAGDSDVNGNKADPIIDYTYTTSGDTTTVVGTVWTTTAQGNTIDLTLTVAKGYVAKIKVRRDNDNYYNNPNDATKWDYLDAWRYDFTKITASGTPVTSTTELLASDPGGGAWEAGITEVAVGYGEGYQPASAFPGAISGQQHFRFTMPTNAKATPTLKPTDPTYVAADDTATDVTVIVTFEKVNEIPRPYDPDNKKMDNIDLDRGFIYGENRGDFAVIEIPTLAQEDKTDIKLYDTDNYDTPKTSPLQVHDPNKDAGMKVTRYIFALYDADTDTYTELVEGTDVVLLPYDEDALAAAGDPYNYILGLYEGYETLDKTTTTKREFVGSKLLLLPTEPDAKTGKRTAGAEALYKMLNNEGSLESYETTDPSDADKKITQYRTTLYVMAEDATLRQSAYTPVWIRPWFALGVNVISYAPTHELQGELYRLMTQDELDLASGYKDKNGTVNPSVTQIVQDPGSFKHYQWTSTESADFTDSIVLEDDAGSGKWLQVLRIRSSELLGPAGTDYDPAEDATATPPKTLLDNVKAGDNLTYALVLKKDAHLTYTRVNIDLNPHNYTTPALTDYYLDGDPATRTFMVQDTVQLIAGDVDGNRRVKAQDYDAVLDFVYRNRPWDNTVKTEPAKPAATAATAVWDAYNKDMEKWSISVYNPNAWAYRADVNGDRKLTIADATIVRTVFNYNRTEASYDWRKSTGTGTVSILPFGLGPRDTSLYASLFALGGPMEGELPADDFWDQLADLDSEEAVDLDTIWVDEEGNLWKGPVPAETPETSETASRSETPEKGGRPTAAPAPRPGEQVETPLGEDASLPAWDVPVDLPVAEEPETPAVTEDAPETPPDTPEPDTPVELPAL